MPQFLVPILMFIGPYILLFLVWFFYELIKRIIVFLETKKYLKKLNELNPKLISIDYEKRKDEFEDLKNQFEILKEKLKLNYKIDLGFNILNVVDELIKIDEKERLQEKVEKRKRNNQNTNNNKGNPYWRI